MLTLGHSGQAKRAPSDEEHLTSLLTLVKADGRTVEEAAIAAAAVVIAATDVAAADVAGAEEEDVRGGGGGGAALRPASLVMKLRKKA